MAEESTETNEIRDAEETRKLAKNWREYLGEFREMIRVYKDVWKLFIEVESRYWLKQTFIALVASMVFATLDPWFAKSIFDGLAKHEGNTVLFGVIGGTICLLVKALCEWRYMHAREYIFGFNQKTLDLKTTSLFFGMSWSQHLNDKGDLNSTSVDKGRARTLDSQNMLLFEGMTAIVELAFAMVGLLILTWFTGLISMVIFLNYIIWMFFLNRHILEKCTPIESEYSEANRYRGERLENVELVKVRGKEKEEVEIINRKLTSCIEKDRNFWIWFIKMITARSVITTLMVMTMIAYGSWCVWVGDWSIGLLYPLYRWARLIGDNMWRFAHIEQRLNYNMASIRAMLKTLLAEPDIKDTENAIKIPKHTPLQVELRNFSLRYDITERGQKEKKWGPYVLRNFSLKINQGDVVALIGSSGAGKTSITRALLRASDPTEGNIFVNGHNLTELDRSDWVSRIGYVPQQARVLSGTIRYNLLYGLPEAEREKVSDEYLWEIMKLLRIDFGERLTNGLSTVVGPRGIKLSGGEAQRLVIGAAMIGDPDFLIIDEATASLDSSTEKDVQRGLEQLIEKGKCAVVIAHRFSSVKKICNRFIMLRPTSQMKDGESQIECEASSLEELYERSPSFRILADDQGLVLTKKEVVTKNGAEHFGQI